MFCFNCGSQVADNAVVCPHCGIQLAALQPTVPAQPVPPVQPVAPTQPTAPAQPYAPTQPGQPYVQPAQPTQPYTPAQPYAPAQPYYAPAQKPGNTYAIVGFILSFFVGIAGLICSIMGLNKARKEGADHKGLAIAGIVISAVHLGIILYYVVFYLFLLFFAILLGDAFGGVYTLLPILL